MKKYRFFYHYNKPAKKMSVHYRGKCYIVTDVQCLVPSYSKWNKRQPYIVMQGYASEIVVGKDVVTII